MFSDNIYWRIVNLLNLVYYLIERVLIFQVTFTWQISNRIKYLSIKDLCFLAKKPVIL